MSPIERGERTHHDLDVVGLGSGLAPVGDNDSLRAAYRERPRFAALLSRLRLRALTELPTPSDAPSDLPGATERWRQLLLLTATVRSGALE